MKASGHLTRVFLYGPFACITCMARGRQTLLTQHSHRANNPSRSSSEGSLRQRTDSNARSNFEEVEVPSDMEGEGHPVDQHPAQQRRTSWFGWGSSGGYEKVKNQ